MEIGFNSELDFNFEEVNDSGVLTTPNWVFSDVKSIADEPLQLVTNNSVQIIKNEDV